jgi:uncharacterized protein YgbK (DUF1537 family)
MIGVIADDITGSNDIGVMFSNSGYVADIYSYHSSVLEQMTVETPDVLIFDTDSRLDDEETAYNKVYQATKVIQQAGVSQFYNKTCSVFRGNIGAEFDAMLDALDEEFAVVVLGFPKNGRTTVNATHYIYGEKLENSQFKEDPVNPMTQSNLVDILQSQTKRKVASVNYPIIKQGSEALKQQIQQIKEENLANYIILDVTDQEDLYEIAKAVHQEKVICGSSALAEELPKVQEIHEETKNTLPLPAMTEGKGMFCAAGSLMPQTFDQVAYMKKQGHVVLELDTLSLIEDEDKSQMIIKPLLHQILQQVNAGKNVILHSSNTKEKVGTTKEAAAKRGWSNTEVSKFISETIAAITKKVIQETGQHRFVIAGGDTSATVCKALDIQGMRVWKEIQTGLPSCLSHTDPSYLFVLKSGSFGDAAFIEQAFNHLEQQKD